MKKINEKTEQQSYDYGCLMCSFEIPKWDKLIRGLVDENDIYNNKEDEYGFEVAPHCTILYGFAENVNHESLKEYLMPSHHIGILFNDISVFETKEYDVLKFGCTSKALTSMHKATKHYFDNKWEHDGYNPHVTIAYLKPGTGKKYVRELKKEFTLVPTGYIYGYPSGEKVNFDVQPMEGYTDNNVVM